VPGRLCMYGCGGMRESSCEVFRPRNMRASAGCILVGTGHLRRERPRASAEEWPIALRGRETPFPYNGIALRNCSLKSHCAPRARIPVISGSTSSATCDGWFYQTASGSPRNSTCVTLITRIGASVNTSAGVCSSSSACGEYSQNARLQPSRSLSRGSTARSAAISFRMAPEWQNWKSG
jgi:hypothetical protein